MGNSSFAAGLRNAVGITFRPGTNDLWATNADGQRSPFSTSANPSLSMAFQGVPHADRLGSDKALASLLTFLESYGMI
jgi:hypothetical protein